MFKEFHINLLLIKALSQMPKYAKFESAHAALRNFQASIQSFQKQVGQLDKASPKQLQGSPLNDTVENLRE